MCLNPLPLLFLIPLSLSASASSWAFQQIETQKAQELARSRGSSVVIAVVDTGADIHHPDLKESLWTNPGESGLDSQGRDRASNGIDDDKNGYIDDVHGWNFVTNTPQVGDSEGHGTHIAGIIASQNIRQTGVAPKAQLMILKYYDSHQSSHNNMKNTIRAFRYAVQMGARIINYSGGGPGFNPEEEEVLRQAEKKQILVVAASGNEGWNTDLRPYYPADYPLRNILSVTALTSFKTLPYYANFGKKTVHVAAPGDQIESTLPGGQRGEMSGTSQATAFVTGAAALIWSENPSLRNPQVIIDKIISGGEIEKTLQGKIASAARLNVFRALKMKSRLESAAGFVFENPEESPSSAERYSFSSLDPSFTLGQGEPPKEPRF